MSWGAHCGDGQSRDIAKTFLQHSSPHHDDDHFSQLATISAQLRDCYAVLGVAPSASDAEITRAWRRLVLVLRIVSCGIVSCHGGKRRSCPCTVASHAYTTQLASAASHPLIPIPRCQSHPDKRDSGSGNSSGSGSGNSSGSGSGNSSGSGSASSGRSTPVDIPDMRLLNEARAVLSDRHDGASLTRSGPLALPLPLFRRLVGRGYASTCPSSRLGAAELGRGGQVHAAMPLWARVRAHNRGPRRPRRCRRAIVNPGNGPGPNALPDARYEAAMTELCALPHVQPIGYVTSTARAASATRRRSRPTLTRTRYGRPTRADGTASTEFLLSTQRENMALLALHIHTAWKLAAAKWAEASGASPPRRRPLSPCCSRI